MRVIITGGGTGGHVYPALSIADELRHRDPTVEILFVGTARGLESKVVPKAGYDFKTIRVDYFKRKFTLENIKRAHLLLKGLGDANKVINEFVPDIIVGTGGYVCGPVVLMGNLKGVKTIIHEQNAIPGKTVKILSGFVDKIFTSYEESHSYFRKSHKLVYSGNPVRKEFSSFVKHQSREHIKIDPNRKVIFSVGGSGGAQKVNEAMLDLFEDERLKDVEFHHVTGSRYYKSFKDQVNGLACENPRIHIHEYLDNIGVYMSASDMMISRSGALTLTEIAAMGVPSILIPSPNVAHNHQEVNAKVFEKKGAAVLLREADLNSEILKSTVNNVISDKKLLSSMSEHSKELSKIDATDIICDEIEMLIK